MHHPSSRSAWLGVRRVLGVTFFLLLLWLWPAAVGTAQAKTIYVNGSVQGGTNDGSSWANAYLKLQDALTNAVAGDEIWVVKGVYYPDEAGVQNTNLLTATFALKNGVAIYGGFAGGETSQSARKWQDNVTVLSGDLTQDDTNKDANGVVTGDPTTSLVAPNAFRVVSSLSITAAASLDGFFITAGKADIGVDVFGGGLYSNGGNPTLTNLTFRGNRATVGGGGMFNDNGSSPVLTNVTFVGNQAGSGGGMANRSSSSPTLINASFRGNQANTGGGMYNATNSSPKLTNVLFAGNQVGNSGGGMVNSNGSSPVLTNVTFAGNRANVTGGGMRNDNNSNPQLVNTILWGNSGGTPSNSQISNNSSTPAISYSLVEGQNPAGTGNLDGTNAANNPLFVALEPVSNAPTTAGDYHLQTTSPALDAGNSAANTTPTDLDGKPRLQGNIDLGVYEAPFVCPAGGVLYVKQGGAGTMNGRSWANAMAQLQNALQVTAPCEIWVAKGVYYPDEGNGQKDNDSKARFRLQNDIKLYGGFAGAENNRDERNWETNVTVLSGDLEQNDTGKDANGVISSDPVTNLVGSNASSVVYISGWGGRKNSILDGFTITAGKGVGSAGGGLSTDFSTPTLAHLIVSGNLSTRSGGGMHIGVYSHPTLTQVTFRGNQANLDGGGLVIGNWKGNAATLTDVTFTANRADRDGGGLYNARSITNSVALTNVFFMDNRAGVDGGGLYNRGALTMNGGGFTGNQTTSGGGVYSEGGSLRLTSVEINNNQADTGGGGGLHIDGGDVTLTDTKIQGNQAPNGSGGGLDVRGGSVELAGGEISNNQAINGLGGGLYMSDGATTRLTNVTIAGNQAASCGGICNYSKLTLTNVTVVGNLANANNGFGGGIANVYAPVVGQNTPIPETTLINVTVAGNRAATGGGISNSGKLTLVNTILWGNDAPTDAQLANRNNGTATISYSVLQGQNPAGVGNLDGTNPANDPNFVAAQAAATAPTSAGDYRRQPASPATDVGNDAVNDTATDLAGQPRKQGAAIDLGAYENASVVVEPTGLGVGEPAGTATFNVTLTRAPTADVTINLSSSAPDECSAPGSVQLTSANWQTGATVTVSAADDPTLDGPQSCTIQISATSGDPAYNGVPVEDVTVTVGDDEKPGVVVNPTRFNVPEPNGAKDFVITLLSEPVAPVIIDLGSNAPGACQVTPAKVTLDAANWKTGATAMVNAVNDDIASRARPCTIETSLTSSTNAPYNALVVDDVAVNVGNEDVVGMVANPPAAKVSEPSGTARFTLRLKSQPTADVTVNLTSSNPNACGVTASVTLRPATWQTGEEITVSAVDDRLENGDHPCSVSARASSTDLNYEGQQADVPVTVGDNDGAVQVVGDPPGLGVQEPNSTASFTVKLTSPTTGTVTVKLTPSAPDECSVTPDTVALDANNGLTGLPITVSAVDDVLADGPQLCSIASEVTSNDPAYNGRSMNDVQVTVADNETPDLNVNPDQLIISTPNGSASFTVKLTLPPVTAVFLALSSDNPACTVPGNLTPTANAWQTGETIAVTAAAAGPQECLIRLTTSSTTASYNNLSREVRVTIADPNETLTVNKGSNGSGAVTSNPAGIDCGATCSASFARNSQVTLTATPDGGSTFGSWSGECAGSEPSCQVTMDRAQSVTAAFNKVVPPPQTLTVSKTGSGKGAIIGSPDNLNCDTACAATSQSFAVNTQVTLNASAAAGSTFAGWSGAGCSGTGACQVTLDSAKSVVAAFNLIPPTTQTLTVSKGGNGSGAVTSNPAGIDCGATCSFAYAHNTPVTLSAAPAAGSTFAGWSGAGCSGTGACQVTLDAAKSVIASFNTVGVTTQTLTVSKAGNGGGTVTSSPVGINCGTACSFAFVQDTVVTLTATPAAGSTFGGWSGACSGVGNCQVTLNSAKTVTATFNTQIVSQERKVYLPVVRR